MAAARNVADKGSSLSSFATTRLLFMVPTNAGKWASLKQLAFSSFPVTWGLVGATAKQIYRQQEAAAAVTAEFAEHLKDKAA